MSPEFGEFQSGLQELKQGNYAEGIQLLEKFCHLCEVNLSTKIKEYIQAQMALVKAYDRVGMYEKARVLCVQLAASKYPQVQEWAQQILPSLTAKSSPPKPEAIAKESEQNHHAQLTKEEAAQLLAKGNKALKFRNYDEAVRELSEFCQGTDPQTKDYSQAQMWLVKAYRGNEQLEEAIALCQQLTASNHEATQIWARQYLSNLIPAANTEETANSESPQPVAATKMRIRTLPEFKDFCQQNLLNELKAIETKRKEVLKSVIFVGVVILIIFVSLIRFFPLDYVIFCIVHGSPPFLILFLFLLGYLICFWMWVAFYTSATETYADGFKSKVIQQIFDFINTNKSLAYSNFASDADTDYTMSAFRKSQLFQNLLKPNRINQNDLIYGTINEAKIFFSEITAEIEVRHRWAKYLNFSQHLKMLGSLRTTSWFRGRVFVFLLPLYVTLMLISMIKGAPYIISRMSRGQKIDYQHFKEEVLNNEFSRKTVFKGLFFVANFNKNFTGKTVVLPQLLDANVHSLNIGNGKQVKLEDPEFAKYFTVYANDQVEARYILSTNLMEKLVKFRKKANRRLYVSFVDSMVYIAIENPEDLFEPKLFKTMLSFAPMREYFENLQLMLGIVEDLSLNRIFSFPS